MSGDDLPEGWAIARIEDIVVKVPSINPEAEADRDFHYVDISSIDNTTFAIVDCKPIKGCDAPSRARRPIQPGDVLFSNVRTYLRNIAIVPPDSTLDVCSTGFTVLRPTEIVDPRYLFRYVLTEDFINRVTPQQTGTHYPATSDRVVMGELVPLPPLAEQKRIVAKVETLLARVNAARQRLAKVPSLLKRFRQSVLAAACSGPLTEDWRAKQAESPEWTKTQLGKVCEIIGGSQPSKDNFIYEPRDGHIRFIQIRDYKSDDHLTYIPQPMARRFCSKSDVMVGRYGPPLFQILRGIEGAYNVALMKAVPRNESLANDFLFYLLQDPPLRQDVIQFSERTVGQDGVRKDLLEMYEVQIPPLAEQHEIVRRVEALLARADRIEKRLATATRRVETLTQAILAQAFRGELVPTEAELARHEGRDYESAAVLLERIRASRIENDDGSGPRRRKRKQP